MAEFTWHKMAEESPCGGKGHYILLGSRGAMYYANEYNERGIFYMPNTRDGSKSVESVVAWAEIPPLEDAGESPDDANYRTVRVGRCSECRLSYGSHGTLYCLYLDGEIGSDETDEDGFCYRFEPKGRQEDNE